MRENASASRDIVLIEGDNKLLEIMELAGIYTPGLLDGYYDLRTGEPLAVPRGADVDPFAACAALLVKRAFDPRDTLEANLTRAQEAFDGVTILACSISDAFALGLRANMGEE